MRRGVGFFLLYVRNLLGLSSASFLHPYFLVAKQAACTHAHMYFKGAAGTLTDGRRGLVSG